MYKNFINKNAHYFCMLRPKNTISVEGLFSFTYTSSSDEKTWVECEIVEDRYKVEDGYKITVKPLDDRFPNQDYYQSDFVSLLNDGYIIKKERDCQKVEKVVWNEYLTETVPLVCEGYIVTE